MVKLSLKLQVEDHQRFWNWWDKRPTFPQLFDCQNDASECRV